MHSAHKLRQAFLQFYRDRHHAVIPSAPLIPENDASTLFTSSGMQPLVPYFLGQPHPAGQRICDCQKCFRAVDIDEVGDARHITFFEMLGNWSFGDYFKSQQLPWVFEFLTQIVGLDPSRLYVTVFAGDPAIGINQDNQSIKIWQEVFAAQGLDAKLGERIFTYPAAKNWWSRSGAPQQMPAGEPGGPDSEIFYDFGPKLQLHEHSPWRDQPCHPNCDCGRFLEIGNSVFMQYLKQKNGKFIDLPAKNVDYGGGLERLIMASENQADVFATSLFCPLVHVLEKGTHLNYTTASPEQKRQLRLLTDHTRSAIMLLSEGLTPGNKLQGYVLRRLLRKSLVICHTLGVSADILTTLVTPMTTIYQDVYPQISQNQTSIITQIQQESQKFSQTLAKGLSRIQKLDQITGETAFHLYETYGFPFEVTKDIAAERGLVIDEAQFLAAKQQHQAKSQSQSAAKFKGGLADNAAFTVRLHTATHLLLAALQQLLDPQIKQKGSNITADRARFDFNFARPLTSIEITALQQQVNDWIAADLPITKSDHAKAEALALVGGSLFADRYPDRVSVYAIANVSREICVGPHVARTSDITPITLAKEQSAGAGIRRLYVFFG